MPESRIIPGGKPDPDPTLLTTQALLREIGSLKELFEAKFKGSEEKIEHLKELTAKEIESIETQFKERDIRTEQTSKGNKEAIDAAFAAAKEGVGKQEVLFTKQIDAMNDKIEDVKTRFIANEGQSKGKAEGIGQVGALVIGISFVISAVVSVIGFVINHTH